MRLRRGGATGEQKERESGGGAAHRRRLLHYFGHGAHCHGLNLEPPAQKTAGEPDFDNIIEPHDKVTCIVKEYFSIIYKRKRERGCPVAWPHIDRWGRWKNLLTEEDHSAGVNSWRER